MLTYLLFLSYNRPQQQDPQQGLQRLLANGKRRERSRIKRYKPRYGKNRHPRFLLQIRRNHNRRVTGIMFPAISAQSHVTHVTDGNSRNVTHVRTSQQDRRPRTRQCRPPPRLGTTPPRMTSTAVSSASSNCHSSAGGLYNRDNNRPP